MTVNLPMEVLGWPFVLVGGTAVLVGLALHRYRFVSLLMVGCGSYCAGMGVSFLQFVNAFRGTGLFN